MFKVISLITTIDNIHFADLIFIEKGNVKTILRSIEINNDYKDFLLSISNTNIAEDIYNLIYNKYNIAEKDNIKKKLKSLNEEMDRLNEEKEFSFTMFEKELIIQNLIIHCNDTKFLLKDNEIFYDNVKVPSILLTYFKTAITNQDYIYLNSLYLFWKNVLQKENYSNIEDLFLFIYENGLTITPNGYLFLFRRVRNKRQNIDSDLLRFVSVIWVENTIKNLDNTKCYIYYDNVDNSYFSTFSFIDLNKGVTYIDTVSELMNNIGKQVSYTDNHTKTFDFKIGSTYTVDNVDADPQNYCSYGLHAGSRDYVENNKWLGETIVGVIVNPRDIISVADSFSKLRMRKIHIACIIDNINEFNANLFNYDYEKLSNNDNEEFADYKFNEMYGSALESFKKVEQLKQQTNKLTNDLHKYDFILTNEKFDKIKQLLNANAIGFN